MLKRVPKDLRVYLAEILSDNKICFSVENISYWLVFMTLFSIFLEQPKRSGRQQAAAMSSRIHWGRE